MDAPMNRDENDENEGLLVVFVYMMRIIAQNRRRRALRLRRLAVERRMRWRRHQEQQEITMIPLQLSFYVLISPDVQQRKSLCV
jgi:hypothetical protein